jgi:hypothetical protein
MVDLERPEEIFTPPEDDKAESCVITLFKGGEVLDDALLLWRDTLPERLVGVHEHTLVTPALEIFCIAVTVLHGPGSKDNNVLSRRPSTRNIAGTGIGASDLTMRSRRPLQGD